MEVEKLTLQLDQRDDRNHSLVKELQLESRLEAIRNGQLSLSFLVEQSSINGTVIEVQIKNFICVNSLLNGKISQKRILCE
jgi:hypothetical protein